MKGLLRAAARLYPRAWRDRHGEEFDALIDDLTPRWWYVVDIAVGALIMQISRLAVFPAALAVAGAIAGWAISMALPPVYASSSWVLVRAVGAAAGTSERGQRVRTAIDAALRETAFDERAIAVTLRGEPGRDPVLLQVSASAGSTQAAQQAAVKATGSIIEAAFLASQQVARSAGVQFQVVLPPSLPKTPQRDTTRNSAVGGGTGLVIGLVFAFSGHRLRRQTM
jgi:hypothetical protein